LSRREARPGSGAGPRGSGDWRRRADCEVHPAPEKAISDGAQSLDLAQFSKMMEELKPYVELWKESRKKDVAAVASR